MAEKSCINKQFEFLILKTIYDNKEYQKMGITREQIQNELDENREIYPNVGQIKDGKLEKYGDRLNYMLSTLKKEGSLELIDGKYFPSESFDEKLLIIASILYEKLDPEVKFNESYIQYQNKLPLRSVRMILAEDIINEKVEVSLLWATPDKEDILFTWRQVKDFVAYLVVNRVLESIEYGWYQK